MGIVFSVLLGCTSSPPPDTGYDSDTSTDTNEPLVRITEAIEDPTHDADIQSIWLLNCGGCHLAQNHKGRLNLVDAYDKIVNVASDDVPTMPLITPGDLSSSYLWRKLEGSHLIAGGDGEQMPGAFREFTDPERDTIEHWILDSAPR